MHKDYITERVTELICDATYRSELILLTAGYGHIVLRDHQGEMHSVKIVVETIVEEKPCNSVPSM